MNEHEKALAALRAEGDQAIEAIRLLARMTDAFWRELIELGHEPAAVISLTNTWLAAQMRNIGSADTGEEA